MRNLLFKFQFVVGLLLFACINVQAADGLITKQITIKLDKAGTLPDRIGSTKKYLITNLKIVGEINGTDLRFIREMAGRDVYGRTTAGMLATLDFSEAKITKGGDCYYSSPFDYYTSDDVIGESAFYNCSGLTSVTLPSSVTSIGKYAFRYCSGLTSVTLPSSVTSIGWYAFEGCSGLTSITLPSSVTSIGAFAFDGCSGLTSITLPSSITSIDRPTFSGCNLKECNCILTTDLETYIGMDHTPWVCIPSDMKYYLNGQELTRVDIPSGVNKIGAAAFWKSVNLTSVTIPSSVTSIGGSAFNGCSGLTSITLPSSVTSIDGAAFYGCSGLTSITLPSSVTSIGGSAFLGCSGLTSITIPSSVTSIGGSAFYGCSGLQSVYVSSETPAKLGNSVFPDIDKETCTLYIPRGTYDDYFISEWGDYFSNIVEHDPTGIDKVNTSHIVNAKEISRYGADGQRLDAPAKGLNIVKYSDGSVKKVVVQ